MYFLQYFGGQEWRSGFMTARDRQLVLWLGSQTPPRRPGGRAGAGRLVGRLGPRTRSGRPRALCSCLAPGDQAASAELVFRALASLSTVAWNLEAPCEQPTYFSPPARVCCACHWGVEGKCLKPDGVHLGAREACGRAGGAGLLSVGASLSIFLDGFEVSFVHIFVCS